MADRSPQKIKAWRLAAFAVPNGPMFALVMPLSIFVPAYYASDLGIGLAAVGTVFLVARLWDVVTDPVAGVMMDRLQDRVPRLRWLIGGAPIVMLGTYMIFFPLPAAGWPYLLLWLLIFYIGWTLMLTSLYSAGAELSMDYHERSRIMGALQIANVAGTVLVLVLPTLVERLVAAPASMERMRLHAMALFVLVLMPLSLVVSGLWGPRVPRRMSKSLGIFQDLITVVQNLVFLRLATVELLNGLWLGIITSLAVFFIERVLGHEGMAATTMLILLTANLAAVPVWIALAGRFGKHRMAATAAMIAIAVHGSAFFLPAGNLPMMIILFILLGTMIGAGQFLPRAILADVVDQDRLATGDERPGLYYAFMTTAGKMGIAFGTGGAFLLADRFGYDPQAEVVTPHAAMVIRLLVVVLPMVLNGINVFLLWNFPLDRVRQEALRALLEKAKGAENG